MREPHTPEHYANIVERIIQLRSDELDEWESDFLDDLYMNNKFPFLTDKQKKKILEIHRKYIIYK